MFAGEIGMLLAIVGNTCCITQHRGIQVDRDRAGAGNDHRGAARRGGDDRGTAADRAEPRVWGALRVTLVGTAEFYLRAPAVPRFVMGVLAMEVILGSLTFTGSLMAAGKLQEVLPQRPITFRGQNIVNLGLLGVAVVIAVTLVMHPDRIYLFPAIVVIPLIFGVLMIIPIGGADMPTVISLLNSYAGLSAAAMGFVLNSKLLIIAGALDGASGLILSVNMSKAMNRSFSNVLFGAFGQEQATAAGGAQEAKPVRSATAEEAAAILGLASRVVIVPGYGMAVAQAQHKGKRTLRRADQTHGVDVKFGIHPGGRAHARRA